MPTLYAVIMAGGKGERFWPLSTSEHPKQLLSLVGDKPLLTLAVERLQGLVGMDKVLVVTNQSLVQGTLEAVPDIPPTNVIGEPFGRDTAAACALAMALVKARDPGAVFCILTADHVIGDLPVFQNTLHRAARLASERPVLITIGINPAFPSTGFGYIEAGDPVAAEGAIEFYEARRFVEKPDATTAVSYIDTGRYYWNSGMFVWSVDTLDKAFAEHAPDFSQLAARIVPTVDTPSFMPVLKKEYSNLEKISVDYALMEKADNIVMAKGTFQWDDVGSWSALANHFGPDGQGNIVVGDAQALDSENNIVVSRERLTALIGVSDLIVVQAGGATLICRKDRAQDVKKMVKQLEKVERYKPLL